MDFPAKHNSITFSASSGQKFSSSRFLGSENKTAETEFTKPYKQKNAFKGNLSKVIR